MIISSEITRAIEYCSIYHKNQERKANKVPYASHPISVGFILHSAGYPEEVIIAGILHDILEDTTQTEEDLKRIFGSRVVELVKGVTEEMHIEDWATKKDLYINHLRNAEDYVKAISAADLLDNCRSMLRAFESGIDIWKEFTIPSEQNIAYKRRRLAVIKETLKNEITDEIELSIDKLEALKSFESTSNTPKYL